MKVAVRDPYYYSIGAYDSLNPLKFVLNSQPLWCFMYIHLVWFQLPTEFFSCSLHNVLLCIFNSFVLSILSNINVATPIHDTLYRI